MLEYWSYVPMFDALKIQDEILSRRNSEKLSEIFFVEVYPPKINLTRYLLLIYFAARCFHKR